LSKPGPADLLRKPKLILQQNSKNPTAFFDDGQFLVLNSATYISDAAPDFLKSACVFLNSRLVAWFFRKVITNDARLTVNILPNNLGLIPLPAHFDVQLLAWLCDLLTGTYSEPERNDSTRVESLRRVVDATVLEFYFPQLFPRMCASKALSTIAGRHSKSRSFLLNKDELELSTNAAQRTMEAPVVESIAELRT
jgi:hypothetical protein